jgi:hypothetical protein
MRESKNHLIAAKHIKFQQPTTSKNQHVHSIGACRKQNVTTLMPCLWSELQIRYNYFPF